jgi:hypothetical protein
MSSPLLHEKVWFEKNKYDEAERLYYENLVKVRQIWNVRRLIHGMKQLKDLKLIGIGYSELQYTLDPTHNPLNSGYGVYTFENWRVASVILPIATTARDKNNRYTVCL